MLFHEEGASDSGVPLCPLGQVGERKMRIADFLEKLDQHARWALHQLPEGTLQAEFGLVVIHRSHAGIIISLT
jgi:hypothetical protein